MKWLSWALDLQKGQKFSLENRPQTLALQKGYKPCQRAGKHRRKDETFAACWDETFFN